jgi:hypothetical protein
VNPQEQAKQAELAIRRRLRDDYEFYAWNALKIRTKAMGIKRFGFNSAQRRLHALVEEQRRQTGRVRAIVLKARQQGISTYIGGRFYHQTTHRHGVRAFILTHQSDATNNLFEMTDRFHAYCPGELKPVTGAANSKELSFQFLDSGYQVGTAGTKGTGRGATVQLFHGSEVAFWDNAHEHAAGALQGVPDAEGTEVFLESTGNGLGNYFHEQWQLAVRKESPFMPVFLPWFLQEEYRAEPPQGFAPLDDERELMALYGLDLGQIAWRRSKIAALGGVERFTQEYPANPEEAFLQPTAAQVIPAHLARAAVARDVRPFGPMVWGLDCARFGDDRSALAKRHGNVLVEPVQSWRGLDTMQLAGRINAEYDEAEHRPDAIFVDSIGIGSGVADRLRELLGGIVTDVNVAESAAVGQLYDRLRDEAWFKCREWFEKQNGKLCADDALIAELTAPIYTFTSAGKRKVESKDQMKKRGALKGASPDLADAFVLTFAQDVSWSPESDRPRDRYGRDRSGAGSFMSA